MKVVLCLVPVVLAFLLLAAHFLRAGATVMVAVCLIVPALLVIPRPWVARLIQVLLLVGALEWLRTLVMRVGERENQGEPWLRLAIILGSVALVTVLSSGMFLAPPLRRFYRLGHRPQASVPTEHPD